MSQSIQKQKMDWISVLIQILLIDLGSCQYLKSTYENSATYYDRYLLDSPYNLCRDPLMRQSEVTGTSEASQRSAKMAYLWGGSAWTAETSDFDQALLVDLGTIKNITGRHLFQQSSLDNKRLVIQCLAKT